MEKKIQYKSWTSNKKDNNTKKEVKNKSTKSSSKNATTLKPKTLKNVEKIARKVDSNYYNDYNFSTEYKVDTKVNNEKRNVKPISAKKKIDNKNTKKIIKANIDKEPRNKKKKKRIGLIIFIILLLCSVSVGIYLLCTLKAFDLQKISIQGITKYSEEEIIQKSELQLNTNVFLDYFKGAVKKIEELPYIDSAKLSVKLPNQINIDVKERVSTYFVFDKEKNRFFRLDKDGYILEESDINKKTSEELLTFGITFDDEVSFGSKINEIDITKLYVYTEIENEFYQSGISGKITKANFENSLTTITLNDKLNVVLPNNTNLKYNMAFLKGIIQKIGEDKVGVIDMTKNKPTFSSF